MSLGESIRKGTKWLLAGRVGMQVLQFAFGVAMARILLPADFGMIITVQVFTGFAGIVASGGMAQALVRTNTVEEEDFHVVFTVQLVIGIAVYCVFFAIAPWFPDWFDHPLYTDLLRVSALSFILRPFSRIHTAWLNREMRYRERMLIGLASTLFTGIISVSMALSGFGVWSLIISGLLGSLFTILLISRVTPIKPRLNFDHKRALKFSGFGIKESANELIFYLRKQTVNLIISRLTGAHQVGVFNKADSLSEIPLTVVSGSVYQPVFRAMAKAQDNLDLTRYLFFRTLSLLIVYTLPFYIGLMWLAEPFILVVYGEKWIDSIALLKILAFAGLFYCIDNPCGAVLAAQNRLGRELIVQSSSWLLVIIATYTGLKWGLAGVAWGVVASFMYSSLFMYYFVSSAIKARFSDLVRAILPGLFLNSILISSLAIVDYAFPPGYSDSNPAIYLLLMTLSGALAYCSAFLFIPIPSLASEASRWRKTLKLGT